MSFRNPASTKLIKETHEMVNMIDHRTVQHTKALEKILETQFALNGIDVNTGKMAVTLDKMHTDNTKLVELVSGKRQVPLNIFLVVVLGLTLVLVLYVAKETVKDLAISASGISVKTYTDEPN